MSKFYNASQAVGVALESDHTYLDLQLVNNDTTGLNNPVPLVFNETRNAPFLMNPSLWHLSIVRFSVDTVGSLPLFIPQVQLGQLDPNLLIYSFTLKYKNYEYQQYINFQPQDLSVPVPPAPLVFQDLTTSYYFIFSYQRWAYLVNQSLAAAVTALSNLAIAGGDALPSLNPPFIQFDPDGGKCVINADVLGYDKTLAQPIEIYMNSPMRSLFAGFETDLMGYGTVTNGKNYRLSLYNMYGTNILNLPTYNAIQAFQDYTSLGPIGCAVSSIVFTSTLLPVSATYTALPKIFNSNSTVFLDTVNNNFTNMITDLEIPLANGSEYLPSIYYAPQGEYRLMNMTSNQPLNSIELRVYWRDIYGNLHDLQIGSGCSASVKIMFRKKAFNYN